MNTELINLFHCVVANENTSVIGFAKINQKAVRLGYLVTPDACNEYVDKWLDSIDCDYNSTFYTSWLDVEELNEEQLWMNQLLHYCTTYGTDFALGNGYVPNVEHKIDFPITKLTPIIAVTETEMVEKCMAMINSGIALKQTTVVAICEFIAGHVTLESNTIETVKNREARTALYVACGKRPSDSIELLRYLVYRLTNTSLLIKNMECYNAICSAMTANKNIDLIASLNDDEITALSTIFNRYKKLFLAMKGNKRSNKVINKISHLSKKNHIPFVGNVWSNFASTKPDVSILAKHVNELPIFKAVSLMQMILKRIANVNNTKNSIFNIRNGKMYMRKGYTLPCDISYMCDVYKLLGYYVVEKLKTHAGNIVLPKGIRLAMPTSEKSFIGNLPLGTSFDLNEHNIIGIYWRNEWNCIEHTDYDLSLRLKDGTKIGWDGSHKDNRVLFSGDMTNANPEATECAYLSKNVEDCMLNVNYFSGRSNTSGKGKYRLFFAQCDEQVHDLPQNYMVDPNTIKVSTDINLMASDPAEQIVGIIHDGRVYMCTMFSGSCRSSCINTEAYQFLSKQLFNLVDSFVPLEEMLAKAGYTIYHEGDDLTGIDVKYDFTKLNRDTLINFMLE